MTMMMVGCSSALLWETKNHPYQRSCGVQSLLERPRVSTDALLPRRRSNNVEHSSMSCPASRNLDTGIAMVLYFQTYTSR
jgi:hypothetical protein